MAVTHRRRRSAHARATPAGSSRDERRPQYGFTHADATGKDERGHADDVGEHERDEHER